jgi:hypothetical protein
MTAARPALNVPGDESGVAVTYRGPRRLPGSGPGRLVQNGRPRAPRQPAETGADGGRQR